jgi:hypothetical protein
MAKISRLAYALLVVTSFSMARATEVRGTVAAVKGVSLLDSIVLLVPATGEPIGILEARVVRGGTYVFASVPPGKYGVFWVAKRLRGEVVDRARRIARQAKLMGFLKRDRLTVVPSEFITRDLEVRCQVTMNVPESLAPKGALAAATLVTCNRSGRDRWTPFSCRVVRVSDRTTPMSIRDVAPGYYKLYVDTQTDHASIKQCVGVVKLGSDGAVQSSAIQATLNLIERAKPISVRLLSGASNTRPIKISRVIAFGDRHVYALTRFKRGHEPTASGTLKFVSPVPFPRSVGFATSAGSFARDMDNSAPTGKGLRVDLPVLARVRVVGFEEFCEARGRLAPIVLRQQLTDSTAMWLGQSLELRRDDLLELFAGNWSVLVPELEGRGHTFVVDTHKEITLDLASGPLQRLARGDRSK